MFFDVNMRELNLIVEARRALLQQPFIKALKMKKLGKRLRAL
jgi:hypothetical protein